MLGKYSDEWIGKMCRFSGGHRKTVQAGAAHQEQQPSQLCRNINGESNEQFFDLSLFLCFNFLLLLQTPRLTTWPMASGYYCYLLD